MRENISKFLFLMLIHILMEDHLLKQ